MTIPAGNSFFRILLFRSRPTFELSGPSLQPNERLDLITSLNDEYVNNIGMPVLFSWINVVTAFLENHSVKDDEPSEPLEEPVPGLSVIL